MTDYYELTPKEISKLVAKRRRDHACKDLGVGDWLWPDLPKQGYDSRPQPYAEQTKACASLVEEIEQLDAKGIRLDPTMDGGYIASVDLKSPKRIKIEGQGESIPHAISMLWLFCDDDDLFDDGEEFKDKLDILQTLEERISSWIEEEEDIAQNKKYRRSDCHLRIEAFEFVLEEIEKLKGAIRTHETS